MEVIKHKDNLYIKINGNIFVFDSSWEMFRPIEKLGWNGREITYSDSKFKKDIFSQWYGFGSENMKTVCTKLTNLVKDGEEGDITKFLNDEWFFDRKCSFLPCTAKDLESWKSYIKYIGSKHRTIRRWNDNKKTKRIYSL